MKLADWYYNRNYDCTLIIIQVTGVLTLSIIYQPHLNSQPILLLSGVGHPQLPGQPAGLARGARAPLELEGVRLRPSGLVHEDRLQFS